MYDLLIKNAVVADGSGCPLFHSEIAIQNGKIAAMGPRLDADARQTLDAGGMITAPGFVDVHSHSDILVEAYPECIAALEQGITTQIGGMCGISPAPLSQAHLQDGVRYLESLKKDSLYSPWKNRKTFSGYLQHIDKPLGTHMGFLVGHGTIRAAIMGYADRAPTKQEMADMEALLREAMDGGAMGLSFGLIYPPGAYANTDEMTALCKIVAQKGGVMTVHLRSESSRLVEAVEEMLTVVRQSGVRCVISHHKATGGPANWGKVRKTLELIRQAAAEGFDVFCDQYPYTASSTSLATNIPSHLHALGKPAMLAMLADPAGRQQLREQIVGAQTSQQRFARTMIGRSVTHPEYSGRMLNDIAAELGVDPYELQCDILLEDELSTDGIFHTMCEEDLRTVMREPRAMIGTDGLWYPGCTGTHPRSIASFPRVLGRYVRELKVIRLEEAIRKMTSMPAAVYSLPGKGLVRPGFDADLVIFDPETISDKADYANPRTRCQGLRYVLVGGAIAVQDAVFNGTMRGRVLRRLPIDRKEDAYVERV